MKILVVDDEVIYRQVIAHILNDAGYEVTSACNGQEALSLLEETPFQLVVSDWRMPEMTGPELCKAIREANLNRYVYFILVTSCNRQVDTVAGFTNGADDYISKPFDPDELLMRVNAGKRIAQLEVSNMTIFALAKLAESRDPETGQHLERVQTYCRILAKQLQQSPNFSTEIDDEFVELIYRTSPLHDIGKVAIPDRILLKPGNLTDEEFEIMKTHTTLGAETISSLVQEFPNARFLEMAQRIILSHHEKFSGNGYPYGLAGEEIPLCGRIVALADVYDALTSKRVYKQAYSHESTVSMIVKESGEHFDPEVVKAFLLAENKFRSIAEKFVDRAPANRIRESKGDVPREDDDIVPRIKVSTEGRKNAIPNPLDFLSSFQNH